MHSHVEFEDRQIGRIPENTRATYDILRRKLLWHMPSQDSREDGIRVESKFSILSGYTEYRRFLHSFPKVLPSGHHRDSTYDVANFFAL